MLSLGLGCAGVVVEACAGVVTEIGAGACAGIAVGVEAINLADDETGAVAVPTGGAETSTRQAVS